MLVVVVMGAAAMVVVEVVGLEKLVVMICVREKLSVIFLKEYDGQVGYSYW